MTDVITGASVPKAAQDCSVKAAIRNSDPMGAQPVLTYYVYACYMLAPDPVPHALFACAVQSSSQSGAWPPLPGILLEPKAHVQYGDFDKMVLMQVCSL